MYLMNFRYGTNSDYKVEIEEIESKEKCYELFKKPLQQASFMYCEDKNELSILKMLELMFDSRKHCGKAKYELNSLRVGHYDTFPQTPYRKSCYNFAQLFHSSLKSYVNNLVIIQPK